MQVIIKQENEEIALKIHALMKQNKTNLSRICRDNNLNYTKTYRAIHNETIELEFLEQIVDLAGDGAEISTQFFLSLRDKNGALIEAETIKTNEGMSDEIEYSNQ